MDFTTSAVNKDNTAIREDLLKAAGGINDPTWYRPDSSAPETVSETSYDGELREIRVRREMAERRAAGADPASYLGSEAGRSAEDEVTI